MRDRSKLWQNILWVYPKGPLWDWRRRLGDFCEFDVFTRLFLTRVEGDALSVECPDYGRCGHYCGRSVMWGDGVPEGACLKMLRPDIKLTSQDIALFQLDTASFHSSLAHALGITPYNEANGDAHTWRIGSLAAKPGRRRNVFLTYRREDVARREISRLCVEEKDPFILFTVCHYDLPSTAERMLKDHGVERFSLDQTLEFSHDCRVSLLPSASNIWEGIVGTVVTEEKKQHRFDLPPGADWEDISIHFLDNQIVSISVAGTEKREMLYNQAGMFNKNNGEPSADWQLLRLFANANGNLSWESKGASDRVRQQKRRLSTRLKNIFGLESDPIPWDKERNAYSCRFKIRPDTESSIYHPRQR